MPQSNATTMKYFYDDALGTPVDITNEVLSVNDIDLKNVLERVDPYGVTMPVFTPTGKGEFAAITLGGLFKTGSSTLDKLFAGRIPESSDVATRTFKVEYLPGRTLEVETHLSDYKTSPPKETGLTRCQVVLQPTGNVTHQLQA